MKLRVYQTNRWLQTSVSVSQRDFLSKASTEQRWVQQIQFKDWKFSNDAKFKFIILCCVLSNQTLSCCQKQRWENYKKLEFCTIFRYLYLTWVFFDACHSQGFKVGRVFCLFVFLLTQTPEQLHVSISYGISASSYWRRVHMRELLSF